MWLQQDQKLLVAGDIIMKLKQKWGGGGERESENFLYFPLKFFVNLKPNKQS